MLIFNETEGKNILLSVQFMAMQYSVWPHDSLSETNEH
jgi:hypothetical protein